MNQVTLENVAEILSFFRANPQLTFDQMNDITRAFIGGGTTIIFRRVGGPPPDEETLKMRLIEWLTANAEAVDNDPLPLITFLRGSEAQNKHEY